MKVLIWIVAAGGLCAVATLIVYAMTQVSHEERPAVMLCIGLILYGFAGMVCASRDTD